MGSGKSTVGKKLAKELKYTFVDLDLEIESTLLKNVSEIFEQFGENYFREIETNCLQKIISTTNKAVVSLGGGTVCFNNNIAEIKKNGCLIYLQLDPKSLHNRLIHSKQKRPLIQNLNSAELLPYIESKLLEREKYYLASHIVINGFNINTNDIVLQIKKNSGESV